MDCTRCVATLPLRGRNPWHCVIHCAMLVCMLVVRRVATPPCRSARPATGYSVGACANLALSTDGIVAGVHPNWTPRRQSLRSRRSRHALHWHRVSGPGDDLHGSLVLSSSVTECFSCACVIVSACNAHVLTLHPSNRLNARYIWNKQPLYSATYLGMVEPVVLTLIHVAITVCCLYEMITVV